jgi:hypothetical protein
VHWGWRWDFRKFTVKCNKFYHFCVINLSFKHYVKTKIKVRVSNLSLFITIHNVLMIWYDIWYMIHDIWYMIYDTRYMIYDIWYVIYDIWY